MGRRTGSADLPLHGGRVPPWLAERMTRLGRVMVEALVLHYGRSEVLRRLAHPFWFQSFGAVMGMDWHSSGITTSVIGALKRGLAPIEDELGLYVCGGRGRHSRQTPGELRAIGERTGLEGDTLARTSRLVAKVDSALVQDGFELYLHAFVLGADGSWTVVQQGMSGARKEARRYHWLSEGLQSFVDDPHAAIEGPAHGEIVNLADRRAARAREAQLELVREGPDHALQLLRQTRVIEAPVQPHLIMPAHHDVRSEDVVIRRLHGVLAAASEAGAETYEQLVLTPGLGARTLASLALVAEVIHGAPSRFSDPARFSAAHGGKDGHPFPVPLKVYDQTIRVLRDAVDRARLGNDDKLSAIERLDRQARLLEQWAAGPSFEDFVEDERQASHLYGGRTVFGPAKPLPGASRPRREKKKQAQLALPGLGRAR